MNVQHVSHVILQWNIMINPGISGSNCVGEKVRHLTTTLPQLVAADISNFLTAVESSPYNVLFNSLPTLSARHPSSRQNDKSVPVSLLKRKSENMNSKHTLRFGGNVESAEQPTVAFLFL